MKNKEKLQGADGFEKYYGGLFGERWQILKDSLALESVYIKLDFGGEPYFLDAASVCSALCLNLCGAEKVLDLCAAPGGKSLVISGNMESGAVLFSNERSGERKSRLDKVIASVLGDKSKSVVTSCSDGATWCRRESECYNAILLDAPCSSERHVLSDAKYLNQWSPSRIKNLAQEQWALLSSAWRLLAPGGYLVYATCALSTDENDGVVSRLLKKFDNVRFLSHDEVKTVFEHNLSSFCGKMFLAKNEKQEAASFVSSVFSAAQRTEHGFHILPDIVFDSDGGTGINKGAGPIYFSVAVKI